MRRRLLLAVGLFGLLLSLLFGGLLFAVFYLAEDAAHGRLLRTSEQGDRVLLRLGELPPEIAEHVRALPPGKHELDLEGVEMHVLRTADDATVLKVVESANQDGLLELGVLCAVLLGGAGAFGLAMMLVHRTVWPIEQLTGWLRQADPNLPMPNCEDPELHMLGQTLNAHLLQSHNQTERERAFLREASHELRTPLSIIRAVCEVAETDGLSEAALARLVRSSRRMEHTVEGLLALARSEQSVLPSSFEEEWQALGAEFRDAPGPRPELVMERSWDPVEPLASRLLILALGTLLRNAAEHAGATRVAVGLDRHALRVRDDGKGIGSLAELRTALATHHPPAGGGLGLALVQRICLRMDWTLSLNNLPEGFEAGIAFHGSRGPKQTRS